jgi:hypothetical protein
MKTRLIFFFLTLLLTAGRAQDKTEDPGQNRDTAISSNLASETVLEAEEFIGADELGNLFYMENQVFYRKSGPRIFSFSNVDLGTITSVDVSNPFKILLLYRDFNSVIILDNNLNELSRRLDFTGETQFNNVLFVGNSSQNNIWLYADDNKLHLYNYETLSEELQTQAMTFYEDDFTAHSLASTFKRVWIQSESEALEFNEYGNYVRTYPIDGAERIFPFQKGILVLKDGTFEYFFENERRKVKLDFKGTMKNVSVSGSSLFIYDGKKVSQYRLQL